MLIVPSELLIVTESHVVFESHNSCFHVFMFFVEGCTAIK